MTTHFFIHGSPAQRDFFFLCGDLGNIFHRNASAEVGGVVRVKFTFGQFQISNKAVQMNVTYEHRPAMTFIGFSTSIRPTVVFTVAGLNGDGHLPF